VEPLSEELIAGQERQPHRPIGHSRPVSGVSATFPAQAQVYDTGIRHGRYTSQGVGQMTGTNRDGGGTLTNSQDTHKLNANGFDMGIKSIELFEDYTMIETLEIIKRPGQTLGFYIREGDGADRADGVFISRIAPGGIIEQNGLLRVGEEIVAVDSINVTRMSLDDVVILISIPRRLVMTVKTKKSCCKNVSMPVLATTDEVERPPVFVRRGHTSGVTSSVSDVMTDMYADDVSYRHRRLERGTGLGGPGGALGGPGGVISVKAEVHRDRGRKPTRSRRPGVGDKDSTTLVDWYGDENITDEDVVYRELPRRRHYEHRSWDRTANASPYPGRHYHPDYSSDTDAQYIREQMPPEWRERRLVDAHRENLQTRSRAEYEAIEMKELGRQSYMLSLRDAPDPGRRQPISATPRYVSDSAGGGEGHPPSRASDRSTVTRLVKPGEMTNSLPQMDSGRTGSKDELKHWLRKLDRLSFELQDFNHKELASREDGQSLYS